MATREPSRRDRNEYSSLSPMEMSESSKFQETSQGVYEESAAEENIALNAVDSETEVFLKSADLGKDDEATNTISSPAVRTQLTWHNILSLSFLTCATVSAVLVTSVPFTLFTCKVIFELTHRWFFSLPIAGLRLLAVSCTYFAISRARSAVSISTSCCFKGKELCWSSLAVFLVVFWSMISFLLHGLFVPRLFRDFGQSFFYELDGTIAVEWHDLEKTFFTAMIWSRLAAVLDFCVGLMGLGIFFLGTERGHQPVPSKQSSPLFSLPDPIFHLLQSKRTLGIYQGLLLVSLTLTAAFLVLCGASWYTFLIHHDPPEQSNTGPFCDPLDTTECLMPFPSSFFTQQDDKTVTGRRVNIPVEALSTMYKGHGLVHPSFLNEMDGFSTLAPIIFYLEGMKEGGGLGMGGSKLPGPEEIEISTTSKSVTLLVDVETETLVHHFAEIDFMDQTRPSIVLQPTAPLRHNSTYAVALMNAIGANGDILPASAGLRQLLGPNMSDSGPAEAIERRRADHFKRSLIPALKEAAPWFNAGDQISLQMLFDFHTVSAESQLGLTRMVRDGALQQVASEEWGGWGDHNVRSVKITDKVCEGKKNKIARVVHGEIDVPWFLHVNAPRHRASFFDMDVVESGEATDVLPVKFVVLVPCSLVNEMNSTNLKAVVDFGHSFLYSRAELIDSKFLHRIANDNGYLMVASNWRGMANLDLPVVLRTFVAQPNLFKSARDNLIQGYADKAAIQHFCRNGLLEMDFLKFKGEKKMQVDGDEPQYVFYGISQGGILGGGYSSLMGPSKLIDRSILGSAGTPFALLMSRSDIFPFYRALLLLNLYHLRHVRIVLSLMQMAWDSVESSGILAPPRTEPHPRTLIQTGLGDSTVTTYGAEIMARAFNAAVLPHSPRQVFGLPVGPAANSTWSGPHSVLSEVVYKKENSSLPMTNDGVHHNSVHWCTRLDPALQRQLVDFINSGRIVDICIQDGCFRENSTAHCK